MRDALAERGKVEEDRQAPLDAILAVVGDPGVWVVDGLPAVEGNEEILVNLVEDFVPPGGVEQLQGLADRLVDDEPAVFDRAHDLRVDRPC
ncbi:hypothetical protein [Actinosynnema sp. NPDC023587]|uniref:hypothetical protein n=1 Tax=Actinosynnema sp. NPDC023587 TaxID=3154695 RepID=UPI003401649C